MNVPYRRIVAFAALCPFVFVGPAFAQTTASTVAPVQQAPNLDRHFISSPDQSLPPGGIVGSPGPFVGISLKDSIAYALANNTDLAISESNKRIAGFQIVKAKGPFDVKFQISPSFSFSKIPAVTPFQAGPGGGATSQLTTGLQSGITGTTLGGTQFNAGLSMQRVESNSTANAYDPYFPTALSFSLTQPFGKGRFTADRRDLELAVQTRNNSSAQALVTASTTITDVSNTYWDLVAAWRHLGIQEQALHQIKGQAASNERLARRGSTAPVDVIESNTQVDVYQDNVYAAIQNVATLQNRLKSLILANPLDRVWSVNLVPTSSVAVPPPEPTLEDVVVNGLLHRPEVAQLLAAKRQADIQREFASDQAKPEVNFQVGYTASGFAGENGNISANPLFAGFTPIFSSLNQLIGIANTNLPAGQHLTPVSAFSLANPASSTGRFGKSFSTLFSNTYPTYTAQLNFALPFRNDAAKGSLGIATEQEQQIVIDETALIQHLIFDARNSIQALDSARYRLQAAHNARLAADRVLLGEQRRFAVGRSTTFLVLQRDVEAANDQGRELQAQTDLNKAIVELDRVSGLIFEKNGITLTAHNNPEIPKLMKRAGVSEEALPLNVRKMLHVK